MNITAKGNSRILLRKKLLAELYTYYFDNNGDEKSITDKIEDNETRLAYIYLEQKGLIELRNIEQFFGATAKINAYGIDEVESEEYL